jgi:hypothetical protein
MVSHIDGSYLERPRFFAAGLASTDASGTTAGPAGLRVLSNEKGPKALKVLC